jgi:hypothetical protein
MRENRTSGTVRGEGGNILTYSAIVASEARCISPSVQLAVRLEYPFSPFSFPMTFIHP